MLTEFLLMDELYITFITNRNTFTVSVSFPHHPPTPPSLFLLTSYLCPAFSWADVVKVAGVTRKRN